MHARRNRITDLSGKLTEAGAPFACPWPMRAIEHAEGASLLFGGVRDPRGIPKSRVANDGRHVAGGVLVQNWRKFGEKPAGRRREAGETAHGTLSEAAARLAARCSRCGRRAPSLLEGRMEKKRAEETVPRKACTRETRESPKRALSTNGRAAIP